MLRAESNIGIYLCYNKIPIPPIPAIFITIIIMIIYLFY